MDLTKDEFEYLLRRVEDDITMWDHDLIAYDFYKQVGIEALSARSLERSQSAKKNLQLLQRKLKACMHSMEVK